MLTRPLAHGPVATTHRFRNLPMGQSAVEQTSTMPVYDGGVHVYGDEGVAGLQRQRRSG